ncbi:hypothetical protein AXG93_4492s1410 [Marchantia polymorpha subsp. ruderalis]|uniref:Peptidase S8/S53 domain-containing protein n=1 Tax=Marchantia polymorpha subsp. ruderalis TaxID=1480154 RepID=A0A176W5E6_MARPO|nr:hypothetical protein AXG93_4492s1410 [Marchantia polymorpha subsp. ruderalis]
MERKKPPAHAGLAVQWLFFIVFVVQANADDGSAHTRPHYKECSLGKGQVKIYNCGNIYDINGTGVVQLQNFKIPARYTTVWLGMLILINGGNLSQLLSKEATSVDFVEVDGKLRVCGSTVQGNPPSWGLDRIDHFAGQSLLNGLYTSTSSGTGVHVYVLDTDGNGTSDCNGHGTHCAGIVGGVRTGVAKDVLLHPVRIMGCDGSGSYGALIAGLDWVSVNLIRPAVLSMSVSTRASISIDQAINNMVNRTGVIGIAAAGNLMQEACNFSPAHAASVITVGSTNSLNEMSWFSNYGPCTTMFAPGELVYSSYFQNDTSYATLSGTSMACPHVAGAAALYLSQNPLANPVDIRQSLMDATESNAVSTTNLKPGTTTRLLNTNTKQIFYRISPRSFYNASENSTYPVVVNLLIKPATTVFLTPEVDPTIGYFSPKLLLFPADATWSNSKTINLVLLPNSDYLDHSAPIQWIFNSKDTRFVASPEGWITAQDTGVCKKTATNRCGQDVDYPKVIPSLPFYYIDDSSQYQDIYNESFDARCHSNGPDLLFQYTPSANTFINISLCGATTQFDSLLSVYEYKKLEKKNLSLVAWNDDYCGSKSMLINVPMVAGHMIDGYHGGGGPLEIYIYGLGSPLVANPQPVPTSIPVMLSSFFTSIRSAQEICTLWKGADCPPVPAPLPIQAEFFWSPVRWGPCDKHCAGGLQQAVMQCFTGNYSKVDTWNCAQIPVPVIYQVCNLVACNNYTIFEGPWDECNRSCGAGIQKRQVICMDNMGNTAHPERCGGEIDSDIIQTCNQQACNESRWEVAPWDFCNVPCAGGRKYRTTACYLNGAVVDDGMCDNLFAPLRELECNTQPCQTYAWLIGRWEDCPYVCNATKDRVVAVAARLQVATEALVLTGVETMNTLVGDCSTISEMKLGCLGTGHAQLLAIFNFSVLPIPLVNLTFMTIEEADVSKILMSLDDTPNGEVFILSVSFEGTRVSGAIHSKRAHLLGEIVLPLHVIILLLFYVSLVEQLCAMDSAAIPFIKGLKIKEVQHVARAGVCGNGMCERGERCSQNGQSSTTDGPCCSADCPYVPIACPITLDGPRSHVPCSKNGICHDASGQCDCFEGKELKHAVPESANGSGYQGDACDMCLKGYVMIPPGQCLKVPDALVLKNLSMSFNVSVKSTDGNVPKGSSAGSAIGVIICIIIFGGAFYMCWKTYGQSISSGPAAQGALQALGLGGASNAQDAGNISGGAEVESGSWNETSAGRANRQARRNSLKEERREAVEERRKSRTHGPEHSAVRKSLMMTQDAFGGVGAGRPQSPPGFSPAPMSQQQWPGGMMGDGGVISNVRRSLVGESNNYARLDAPGGYKDEEPSYRPYTRNEEPPSYKDISKDEDRRYQNFPSSSSNFFDGPPSPSNSDIL